jgi:hypothetical protein
MTRLYSWYMVRVTGLVMIMSYYHEIAFLLTNRARLVKMTIHQGRMQLMDRPQNLFYK